MENQTAILNSYVVYLESLERFNLSAEQMLQEKISFDVLQKRHEDFMKKGKKLLKDNGISVKELEAKGKALGSKIKKHYDDGKTPKETSKFFLNELNKTVSKAAKPVVMKMKAMGDDAEQLNIFAKIALAVVIFILMIIVHTMLLIPLALIFTPQVAGILSIVVIAPFVEEATKAYFVASNMPWTGTSVVFGIEFVMYVMNIMAAGGTIGAAIVTRGAALMMHFATTYIQNILRKKGEKESDPSKYAFAGWVAGVAIHLTWNSLAIVYNKEIADLMGVK